MADNIIPGIIKEAARLIHMESCIDDPAFIMNMGSIYTRLLKEATPRCWLCYASVAVNGFVVDFGSFKVQSKDLSCVLAHCKKCVLLAATLGPAVDRLIARVQREDMADALVLDAMASALVEHCCDSHENLIPDKLCAGEYLTMRFSPGYGDVPPEASAGILTALDAAKRIGLSMTTSYMLVPMKSVTAFIGISDRKEERGKSCDKCTITESCRYRERGEFCGVQDQR